MEIAEKLHLTLNGYQRLESGERQFDIAKLQRCATIFGITLPELLSVDKNSMVYLVNFTNNMQQSNLICIGKTNKTNHVFSSIEILTVENEKLKAIIEHQEREITLLRELLATLKQS